MLAELDRLLALGFRGHVDFVDDNLIGNKKAVKRFLPALRDWQERHGYPFMFSTEASINLADDTELLAMMRAANFFVVFVGIESPDEATLVATRKKQNARRSLAESVERINAAGMFVTAGFIVGFDTEGVGTGEAMIDCVAATNIPIGMVGLLTALPNTQLTRRLEQEGRLFANYDEVSADTGDQCTAGLNFRTLRPRAEVMADYRAVLQEIYDPATFFARVRRLARRLDRPSFGQPISWRGGREATAAPRPGVLAHDGAASGPGPAFLAGLHRLRPHQSPGSACPRHEHGRVPARRRLLAARHQGTRSTH